MSDAWLMVLVVAGFHIYESVRIVRSDTILFFAGPFSRLRVVDVIRRGLPIASGRAAVLGPVFPLSRLVVADPWPVRLSSEGILFQAPHFSAPHLPAQSSPAFLPYGELTNVERVGTTVRLSKSQRFYVSTRACADSWVVHLRELVKLDVSARPARIESILRDSLSSDPVARKSTELVRLLRNTRYIGAAMFLFFFVLLPINLLFIGIGSQWFLFAYLALVLLAEGELWRAHRRLWPERKSERLQRALTLPVYPVEVMHAGIAMELEGLAPLQPLAAVARLGTPSDRDRITRAIYLGLQHAPEAWIDPTSRHVLEEFAEQNRLDLSALTAPPEPLDATSRAYCPFCDGQFVDRTEGECPDCQAIRLLRFPQSAPG